MPPLSLLFSSDQETSRVLIRALQELEFRVEHCPEIFAAVERLTTRKSEMLLADWDDGLEASFLLKTSRELKANQPEFTIAVVSTREAETAAKTVGADFVLKKPFTSDQAKYALLTCDTFLARMRKWLPAILAEAERRTAAPEQKSTTTEPVQASEAREPTTAPARHYDRTLASGPGSVLGKYAALPRKSGSTRANRFLIAALATTLLACGYAFSGAGELQSVATAIPMRFERVLQGLRRSDGLAETSASAASQGANDLPIKDAANGSMHVHVVPIHRILVENAALPKPVHAIGEVQPSPQSLPSVPAPAIPESLRAAAFATPSGATGNGLLDALEPVSLTEDLSQNLLLEKVQPRYPEQALRSGLQGSVVLQALIGRDGRIQNLTLVQGSFLLGQSAYQAVKQWRYRPYFRNGHAVQAQTFVTVDFSLPTRSSATLPLSH